uniref:Uncharacterized protein n=1 Tax=Marseillevirus LCMAC201 TaxID=2506605 RepID=A0A481YX41_9VIRU|nr:MAG: uncharacterized protein LCMAC201_05130 [Marseillevirus LCMAC201]
MTHHINQSLDTHHYDGKLHTNTLIKTVYNLTGENLIDQKNTYFTRLIQDLKLNPIVPEQYRPTAIEAVNQITRSIRKSSNYDKTNGMYADDVLYLVCRKIDETKNTDALVYLSEQLSDIMTSGQCPQGRSTRIFQVLMALSPEPEVSDAPKVQN